MSPLALVVLAASSRGRELFDFRVCGQFCGPGWCNGDWRSEWDSDPTACGPDYGDVQASAFGGAPACADLCCRDHDRCCAPGGTDLMATKGCNKQIVDCLAKCQDADISCTDGPIPVPASAVWCAPSVAREPEPPVCCLPWHLSLFAGALSVLSPVAHFP